MNFLKIDSEDYGMTFYKVQEAVKNILRGGLLKCSMLPFNSGGVCGYFVDSRFGQNLVYRL